MLHVPEKLHITCEIATRFSINFFLAISLPRKVCKPCELVLASGLINFLAKASPPKSYAGAIDKKIFKNLFQQLIGTWEEKENAETKHTQFHTVIKKKLNKPVFQEKTDVDYLLQPKKIEGLLKPQDITMISKNGNILAAQAIDFNHTEEVITKHAYELEVIINSLEKFGKENINKKHQGSYYLLFNKPAKNSPQEKLLNEIKKTKSGIMNIEEASYLNELETQLQKDNYGKFSLFESQL